MNGAAVGHATLTVGAVTAHVPEPFGTVARTDDGRHWQDRP